MIMRLAPLNVLLANPRGFCAGVERAIATVEAALGRHGAPVYVRHEIVHNQRVVEELQREGVVFVDEVSQVPEGAVVVFSAHGVSSRVEREARARSLRVFDATCPLVSKVHRTGERYARQGYDLVLIGHAGHAEVEGTLGRVPGHVHLVQNEEDIEQLKPEDPSKIAYITQTTLSLRDTQHLIQRLQARFPHIRGPHTDDICYATQNRQYAVENMVPQVELLLVVGAPNSSNSNRLRELGERLGVVSYLLPQADQLEPHWLEGVGTLGLTAGASAPDVLVREVIEALGIYRSVNVTELAGPVETVKFVDVLRESASST